MQLVRETLAEPSPAMLDVDDEHLDLGEQNIKQCKRKICDGHYTMAVRVLSSFGVATYSDATLEDLKTKHPFKHAPTSPTTPIDHHHLIASPAVVLDRIKSFSLGMSCGRDGLCAQHLMDCLSGAVVAISDGLVSSITQVVNLFLDGKCSKMLGEYIASAPLTPLVKPTGGIHPIAVGTVWMRLVSKVGAIMLGHSLDGLQFGVEVSGGGEALLHAVNRLIEGRGDEVGLSMLLVDFKNAFNLVDREDWYLDYGTIVGDTLVARKVLELIMEDDPRCGLHLNPMHGVKLLGGPASVDFDFSSELVMKRVAKTIELMDAVARINDPQWFGYWQWRVATLPFAYGGLGVYSAAFGPTFDDALCVFNTSMKTNILSNTSEIVAPKLMKKLPDIYFTRVTNTAESTFSLFPRQMALWKSQMKDHTSDWLRAVSISGLGQTMNSLFKGFCCGYLWRPCCIVRRYCHNVVRDTLVDRCYRSGISASKEFDIGLEGGCDKPLRPADMLLYSWVGGLDVCVDLTGSSPLTQTGMVDFAPGRAVIDAAQRKRVKYEAKCATIGYGFLPFSFSSLGELEKDAVTLLKRIHKFSMTKTLGHVLPFISLTELVLL
ncbi:hypothetical protein Tco_1369797 [Tanacetum coccineum]